MANTKSKKAVGTWPESQLETVSKCPVCGSEKRTLLHAGLTDRIFFCAPGEWSLYCCADCQSGYLDPRPTEDSIGIAYQSYFTHQSNNIDFSSLTIINKFRRTLANGYRNWRFRTKHRHASFLGVLTAMLMPQSRKCIDAGMRHLPRRKGIRTLLDFGCGNGDFLMQAKLAGWDCVGIDFDAKAVEAAQSNRLDVRQGGISALQSLDKQFDYITLSHIIEHVHNPEELLAACYDRLKPGGSIWIETPNFNSQGYKVYGPNWRGLEPPRHLILFTPQSLTDLLSKVGLIEIEHQSENPAITSIFNESEAIRLGNAPNIDSMHIFQKKRKQWKKYEKRARKNVEVRELITLTAKKTL